MRSPHSGMLYCLGLYLRNIRSEYIYKTLIYVFTLTQKIIVGILTLAT